MTIEQAVERLNAGASVDVTTSEIVRDSKSHEHDTIHLLPKLTDVEARLLRGKRGVAITDAQREWLREQSDEESITRLVAGWGVRKVEHAYPEPFWSLEHIALTSLGREALEHYDCALRSIDGITELAIAVRTALKAHVADHERCRTHCEWIERRAARVTLDASRCSSFEPHHVALVRDAIRNRLPPSMTLEVRMGNVAEAQGFTGNVAARERPPAAVMFALAPADPAEFAIRYGAEIGTVDTGRVAEVRERPRRDAPDAIEVRMHVGHPSPALLHALHADDLICLRGFRDVGNPRIVLPGIASQVDLARAMFVASLWEEIDRRAERRDLTTIGAQRPDTRGTIDVIAVMWGDPTYARQRAECEKAAERVWVARKAARNMCDHGTGTTCDACSETSRSQRGKR